ncbi:MAG: hypothetical protein ACP5Q5_00320 [Brevinematia bacterium]
MKCQNYQSIDFFYNFIKIITHGIPDGKVEKLNYQSSLDIF